MALCLCSHDDGAHFERVAACVVTECSCQQFERGALTADTITDEQISKLCVECLYAKPIPDSYGVDLCDEALGKKSRYKANDSTPDAISIRRARARCAEILNARSAK